MMSLFHAMSANRAATAVSRSGFWDRGLAKLIDCILIGLGFFLVDLVFGTSFITGRGSNEPETLGQLAVFVIFCVYSAWLESSRRQATLGKRMIGIVVTDLGANRITFRRALLRSVMQIIPLGYLPAVFGGRALHDRVADTMVVPGTV
jgi:uncharacterized RDD family membrane protein YckC